MTFYSENKNDLPLLWSVQSKNSGGKMGLEIQDEMIKEGVSKRVIFDSSDSTWTMTIGFNNNKQGTKIHASAMFRDSIRPGKIEIWNTSEKKKIESYDCKKILIETLNYKAEVWVTDNLSYNICYTYQLLAHCGLLSKYVKKGDWYWVRNLKGMILEVTSTKISTGETYSMKLSNIHLGETNKELFDLTGYRISIIPEGLNCGFVEEE